MSWQAVSYAVGEIDRNQHLTVADRLVLVLLAEYANRSGNAWPSAATVATRAGIHPSSLRRIVARLETAGIIAVDRRDGTSSLYRFPLTAPLELSTPRAPERGVEGEHPAPYSADPAPPSAGVRAPGRDEPVTNRSMNQRPNTSGDVCVWCEGIGWEYQDDNHVMRCRAGCAA